MIELNQGIEIIAEASSGEEALERLGDVVPNIVLLDVRMPGMGGIETLRQIKEHYPEMQVIVLTLYGDQYLSQAIEAGTAGYLIKDVGDEELIRSIRTVSKGDSVLHSSLSRGFFKEFASLVKGENSHKVYHKPPANTKSCA